ncbi:hypothetical protein P1X15_12875 [Runella sp. MFBS21]|uniref:hypothetical protein n=1 Tax=Runella sp. MFBS21 TaxID=3034018 RepID=UPI0023F92D9A|nr:hypothetical protein [Runella sp. MFBS21]MDF7818500.1 hypothetical protein [Runella sp. MFBS21]
MNFSPKLLSVGIIAMAFTLLLSCEPQSDVTPNPGSSKESILLGKINIEIKDGRLVFANQEDLNAAVVVVDDAIRKPNSSASALKQLARIASFTSAQTEMKTLETALENASNQKDVDLLLKKKETMVVIEDPSLGYLVNKEGYIQVRDQVYRMTPKNKVLQVHESNASLLKDTQASSPLVKLHEVKIEAKMKTQLLEPNLKNARVEENIDQFEPNHRMVWGYKQENYGFYSTAVVLTQCEYKQTYLFRPTEWKISYDANVSFNLSYARIYYWISGSESWIEHNNISESGTGSVFFRMGYAAGIGAVTQVAECHASHSLTWSGYHRNYSY